MTSGYRIRFHLKVRQDLQIITELIAKNSGQDAARKRLDQIEAAIRILEHRPHKGSLRHEIAPNLRAIPAGRSAVVAFTVDDAERQVLVYAMTYGGSEWISRSQSLS